MSNPAERTASTERSSKSPAAKWVREVRHGPADRLLQLPLGAADGVLLLLRRTTPKADVVDRVGADRRGVAGRQLAEVFGGERCGVRRGSRSYLPLLRDGIEGPFDLRHPKRQQVAADRIEVCPDPGRTEREADGPAADRQIDLSDVRWPRAQQRAEAVPPETVVVSQDAAGHEDGDRHALGFGDRQRVGQVVAVAVIKGHHHSRPTRRNRYIGERRRFPCPRHLLEVGGKIAGAYAEMERVLDALRDPVIAENERSVAPHRHGLPGSAWGSRW